MYLLAKNLPKNNSNLKLFLIIFFKSNLNLEKKATKKEFLFNSSI